MRFAQVWLLTVQIKNQKLLICLRDRSLNTESGGGGGGDGEESEGVLEFIFC